MMAQPQVSHAAAASASQAVGSSMRSSLVLIAPPTTMQPAVLFVAREK
jgi:hypothetical protein